MSEESRSTGGLGLGGIVFVVFLTLKLVGVIDWSWWWVTSPLWLGVALIISTLILGTFAILAVRLWEWMFSGRSVKLD